MLDNEYSSPQARTPEQAYEALLRNGGGTVKDQGYTGHPYHWYFDSQTGVLCLACQCGFKSSFPQLVRQAPALPTHIDPGVTE